MDGILFKFKYFKDSKQDPTLRLVIPERLVPHVLYQYHDTAMAGPQGVQQTYHTLKAKFFIHNLFHLVRQYVLACHECTVRKPGPNYLKAFHKRIPSNYRPLSWLSANLKWMLKSSYGMQYILVSLCEVTSVV